LRGLRRSLWSLLLLLLLLLLEELRLAHGVQFLGPNEDRLGNAIVATALACDWPASLLQSKR